jgi:hypothetical protein
MGFVPNRHGEATMGEPHSPAQRLDLVMKTDNGLFGLVVGGIVALAVIVFILSGGELGGKKTIQGDDDLPPVESTTR